MSLFSNWIMTDVFLSDLVLVQHSSATIMFQNVLLSSKTIAPEAIPKLTTQVNTYNDGMSTRVGTITYKGNTISTSASFASQNNTKAAFRGQSAILTYRLSNSSTPKIAAVAVADEDGIRMPDRTQSVTYTFKPKFTLTDGQQQLATESAIFASFADLEELKEQMEETLATQDEIIQNLKDDVQKKQNQTVLLTGNQTVAGTKTFTSAITGSVTGNAGTATKLRTPRTIRLTGEVTGSASFDGSGDISLATTPAKTYVEKATFDATVKQIDNTVATKISETVAKIPTEIGSRNLLRGTQTMAVGNGRWITGTFRRSGSGTITNISVSDSPIPGITQGIKLTSGDARGEIGITQDNYNLQEGWYTLTYWVKGEVGDKVELQAWWNGSYFSGRKTFTLDGTWQKVTLSAENKRNDTYSIGYIYLKNAPVGNSVIVIAGKQEQSSIPSDWSPAPEDFQAEMSSLKSELTELSARVHDAFEVPKSYNRKTMIGEDYSYTVGYRYVEEYKRVDIKISGKLPTITTQVYRFIPSEYTPFKLNKLLLDQSGYICSLVVRTDGTLIVDPNLYGEMRLINRNVDDQISYFLD